MEISSAPSSKRTWEKRFDEAKKKHRPKLKNWSRDGFADIDKRLLNFQRLLKLPSDIIELDKIRGHIQDVDITTNMDRISCDNMSVDEFITHYERPRLPVVIRDIPHREGWNAHHAWNLDNIELFKRHLGMRFFKVGEDDDGYKVKVRMKYFMKYLKYNHDDSPLYVFDGSFDDDVISKSLLHDFHVPSYFRDDLFALVGERKRPPYRWFLIGPERSGSCVHIDPLGTSAWNTLLQGKKRWVLFPPGTSRTIAKGIDVINKGEDDEAVNYFVDILPRIHKTYGDHVRIIEFTQEAGDTVFVPGGWWHAVLNIEDTIAITQNFCSRTNFEQVWRKTRSGRKKMSAKWLKLLQHDYPELAQQARDMNQADNFIMYEKKKKRHHSSTDGDTSASASSNDDDHHNKHKKKKLS